MDVWPRGDRALVVSMAESLELDEIPSSEDAAAVADSWRPWRSVAARMLWHSYLLRRGRAVG
jgi:DNA-3-methyladenine glycosylase II